MLQSMYASFCFRLNRGNFTLDNREDLWRLLMTMTLNKTRNAAARHGSQRRDYRREAAGVSSPDDSLTPDEALAQMEDASPTPAEAAELTEQLERAPFRLARTVAPDRHVEAGGLHERGDRRSRPAQLHRANDRAETAANPQTVGTAGLRRPYSRRPGASRTTFGWRRTDASAASVWMWLRQ